MAAVVSHFNRIVALREGLEAFRGFEKSKPPQLRWSLFLLFSKVCVMLILGANLRGQTPLPLTWMGKLTSCSPFGARPHLRYFLVLLGLCACPNFHTGASAAPDLVCLSNQEVRLLFLRPAHPASSRCQRGAHRGVPLRRGPRTRSLLPPPPLAEAGLFCRVVRHSSRHSQRTLSPWKPRVHPLSAGCASNRPAVLSGRPDGKSVIVLSGFMSFHPFTITTHPRLCWCGLR